MNRILLLLIIVAVLGTGAYFGLSGNNEEPATSVIGDDRNFKVDRAQVYKIFLADRHGNRTTLTRDANGATWTYNDNYPARMDAVNSLLIAVDQIRMRFKPTEAAVPVMVENLATTGIKVEIYGKEDNLLKSYYIGGATNDERGTYIILEGAEQPYVAEIPGWEGNLRFRYNLIGDDWRDRNIFRVEAGEIEKASIEYPKQQNKSFRMDLTAGQAELTPFYPLQPKRNGTPNASKVDAFLAGFENIIATGYNNYNREKTEITAQVPFAVITIYTENGEEKSIKLFPNYGEAFTDPKTGQAMQPTEIESYLALTHNGDLMNLSNAMVKKILWGYEFFY